MQPASANTLAGAEKPIGAFPVGAGVRRPEVPGVLSPLVAVT